MNLKSSCFVLFCLVGLAVATSAADTTVASIEGIWKHRDKPAWIQISFVSGTGTATVVRHDDNPSAEGQDIITEIEDGEPAPLRRRAKMYSAATDGFVEVILELREPSHLVVTYDEQEVLHLERAEPATAPLPESF